MASHDEEFTTPRFRCQRPLWSAKIPSDRELVEGKDVSGSVPRGVVAEADREYWDYCDQAEPRDLPDELFDELRAYEATIEDPNAYAKPWTTSLKVPKIDASVLHRNVGRPFR